MRFDPHRYAYPSRRNVVYGARGMVCTSTPLAAQAGLSVLQKGGNAVDAAVAAAAALTVLEPNSNGLGSDAFALVWHGGRLYGLNASGYSPKNLTLEQLLAKGYTEMPAEGWEPVMVPGAPGGWAELSKRFGRLPLTDALEPAASYAETGYPVSPTIAANWGKAVALYTRLANPLFDSWFATFAPKARRRPARSGPVPTWRGPCAKSPRQARRATTAAS